MCRICIKSILHELLITNHLREWQLNTFLHNQDVSRAEILVCMIHHHLKTSVKPSLAVAHTERIVSLIFDVYVKCLISADILVVISSGSTIALSMARGLTGRKTHGSFLSLSVESNLWYLVRSSVGASATDVIPTFVVTLMLCSRDTSDATRLPFRCRGVAGQSFPPVFDFLLKSIFLRSYYFTASFCTHISFLLHILVWSCRML